LDLDDYNKEVEEGCHITSMAELGWVEGFGGMRIKDDTLHFSPKFQKNGKGIRLKLISETRFWQSQSIIKRLFFNDGIKK
jgi:trehalose/maltose hydrolase-like predicted phosphorylase